MLPKFGLLISWKLPLTLLSAVLESYEHWLIPTVCDGAKEFVTANNLHSHQKDMPG
jgi:hypothetical protein